MSGCEVVTDLGMLSHRPIAVMLISQWLTLVLRHIRPFVPRRKILKIAEYIK